MTDAPLPAVMLAVSRLHAEFLYAAAAIAERHGLTPARWQVLGAAQSEPAGVAGIARELALTRQSVQRVADDVVQLGWARWEANPRHRRAKLLAVTAAGAERLAAAAAEQARWSQALEDRASGDAALRAVRFMDRLADASAAYWDARSGD